LYRLLPVQKVAAHQETIRHAIRKVQHAQQSVYSVGLSAYIHAVTGVEVADILQALKRGVVPNKMNTKEDLIRHGLSGAIMLDASTVFEEVRHNSLTSSCRNLSLVT
jgi:hypothetical protein